MRSRRCVCGGSSTEAPFQGKDAADEGGHCRKDEREGDDRLTLSRSP
jgi:hypothetical protein